jgi:c-di-GMP phosphodiesterase
MDPIGCAGIGRAAKDVRLGTARTRKPYFCEQLARKLPPTQSGLFLVGMVSMMDAILDVPMSDVVEKIAIDQDTKCVLLGNGGKLQPMYEMMLAQEAGNWAKAQTFATQLRVSESELGEMWWQSIHWARQVSSGK